MSQSLDHLMQAATQAADGVGATVGPRVNAARDRMGPTADRMRDAATMRWGSTVTALAPLAAAARQGTQKTRAGARKTGRKANRAKMKGAKAMGLRSTGLRKKESGMSRRRGATLTGLLAVGAAAGAAGALVMRRRKQQRWEEYDPNQTIESNTMRVNAVANSARGSIDSAMDSAASGAQRVAAGVDRAADKVSGSAEKVAGKATGATTAAKEKNQQSGPVISGSPSHNSHK